jgi:hypothetical protein
MSCKLHTSKKYFFLILGTKHLNLNRGILSGVFTFAQRAQSKEFNCAVCNNIFQARVNLNAAKIIFTFILHDKRAGPPLGPPFDGYINISERIREMSLPLLKGGGVRLYHQNTRVMRELRMWDVGLQWRTV